MADELADSVRRMTDSGQDAAKAMQLRYPGTCRKCGDKVPAGAWADFDRATKTVTCSACRSTPAGAGTAAPTLDAGTAGASAQREFERRSAKREHRIREAHPHLGGLLLALSDDPQSTTAWRVGAHGEEVLGKRLDSLVSRGLFVLHDRRIPGTKANIDHIVVGASGVAVIDAKRYTGRPSLRVEGGFLRPRTEKLMVGSRDCTKLVAGVHKQVADVEKALESAQLGDVPVRGMLCFVEGDWPILGGDFVIDGVDVLWPRKAVERVSGSGPIEDGTAESVFRALAAHFPRA